MPALAQEATPAVGELQGQIIYAANPSGNYDIYAMNEDGSNVRNLTNNRGDDQTEVWSPDGSQIAFQSKRDGNLEIYVMDANGSNPHNLSNNSTDDVNPNWSPDGKHIAFGSKRDGNWEIYVMDADGSNPQRLTSNDIWDATPLWTPDGMKLVYASQDADTRFREYIMNTDGSDIERFLPDQPLAESANPSWSPDGKKLVLSAFDTPAIHIFVMDADGSNVQQLTEGTQDVSTSPTWSPDGTQIVYVSLRGSQRNVYVMNSDGSNVRQLTKNLIRAQSPVWALTTVISPPAATETATQGTATVNSSGSVNMRSGAGSNNPVIKGVSGGSLVNVLGFNDDHSWVNVRLADGSEGWISASLLTLSTP
ncbi:MAG: SH3 domain-containing protein [Chloroflexota bacterium]